MSEISISNEEYLLLLAIKNKNDKLKLSLQKAQKIYHQKTKHNENVVLKNREAQKKFYEKNLKGSREYLDKKRDYEQKRRDKKKEEKAELAKSIITV